MLGRGLEKKTAGPRMYGPAVSMLFDKRSTQ
jgi:hypothetical protein